MSFLSVARPCALGINLLIATPLCDDALIIFNLSISIPLYSAFDSRLSNVAPNSGQSLIVNFLGVIISIGGSFETLKVNIGSSISPVGASCPPRKFTTDLIGNPIRL